MNSVSAEQRFSRNYPCPVCGGYEQLQRGHGVRCHGFISSDRKWAHCSRDNMAGQLPLEATSNTYAHKLHGDCRCGTPHGAPLPPVSDRVGSKPEAIYSYRNELGEIVYQVLRYGGKSFSQRRPNGEGGWIPNLNGIQPLVYNLPELLAADPAQWVFVTEGEKDSNALSALGLIATTNSGGAGKWKASHSQALRGRQVAILPDNDHAGRYHAEMVARSLAGTATSVRVVALPDIPLKGDVSDWLAAGGTSEELLQLVADAPEWEAGPKTSTAIGLSTISAKELLSTSFEPVRWAVPDLIAVGLTLLAGRPKVGKSWICLGLAVAVAVGGRAFGNIPVEEGDVLYLALEDTKRRLKDRLSKVVGQGMVPDRLVFVTMDDNFPRLNEGGLERIRAWLDLHPNARLIIIDTLKRVRPPQRSNANVYDQDYDSVDGLVQLAGQRGVAVVVVHHTRKGSADDAIAEVSGSFGLTANADGIIVFKRGQGARDGKLYITGRDVGDQEIAVRWDAATAQWVTSESAEVMHISTERQDVLDVLINGAKMPKDIANELGKRNGSVRKLLRQMLASGQLYQLDDGRYSIYLPLTSGNVGNGSNNGNVGNSGNTCNTCAVAGGVLALEDGFPIGAANEPAGSADGEPLNACVRARVTSVTDVTREFKQQALRPQPVNSETDHDHDRKCLIEVDQLVFQGNVAEAKILANKLRGWKAQDLAWNRINAAGGGNAATETITSRGFESEAAE